jgi:hypothetical protein
MNSSNEQGKVETVMTEEADRINVMDLGDVPPSSQEGTLQRRRLTLS